MPYEFDIEEIEFETPSNSYNIIIYEDQTEKMRMNSKHFESITFTNQIKLISMHIISEENVSKYLTFNLSLFSNLLEDKIFVFPLFDKIDIIYKENSIEQIISPPRIRLRYKVSISSSSINWNKNFSDETVFQDESISKQTYNQEMNNKIETNAKRNSNLP